ncbi:hypothetical protein GWI33_008826 [Rhynchophorus ferrugineus]|uniref:Geranylgeranyl transferase type-2 subunit alpha n=1 Tax=Rhynchophorus ferrugineus TaxID=354439 RepID=A0A834MFL5_RHYFE|nr:hypothetical protein GWI33_008826 [Rhynchophorus ferrugineus]
MHGRLKVKSSEEQKAEKKKEQQKKLVAYQMGMKKILSSRQKETYDKESFGISAQLLCVNPDIYTLWNYRKEVILIEHDKSKEDEVEGEEKFGQFLNTEISLTEQCLVANPKSYGSWHHRYWVLLLHPKPNWEKEFMLCTKYLNYDDRNFHCWDYRRLLINKIGITLTSEIKFSTDRLNANFSNYSSWHYRKSAVFTDPADSSAWFYLRWVLSNPALTKDKKEKLMEQFEQLEELEPDCKWILMAKCWLTGSLILSDCDHTDDRVLYYKRLLKLDPMRKGQYQQYLQLKD